MNAETMADSKRGIHQAVKEVGCTLQGTSVEIGSNRNLPVYRMGSWQTTPSPPRLNTAHLQQFLIASSRFQG